MFVVVVVVLCFLGEGRGSEGGKHCKECGTYYMYIRRILMQWGDITEIV